MIGNVRDIEKEGGKSRNEIGEREREKNRDESNYREGKVAFFAFFALFSSFLFAFFALFFLFYSFFVCFFIRSF